MTEGTRALLVELDREGGMYAGCGTGNAPRFAALRRQGFAEQEGMGGRWFITECGRSFLAQEKE